MQRIQSESWKERLRRLAQHGVLTNTYRWVSASIMLPIVLMMIGTAPASAQQQCSAAASLFTGGSVITYGFSASGIILNPGANATVGSSIPSASLGIIAFTTQAISPQGVTSGTVSGTEYENLDGHVFSVSFGNLYSSTFSINSDCTGTVTRKFDNGTTTVWEIVVVGAGNKIRYMYTSYSIILKAGEMELVSRQ